MTADLRAHISSGVAKYHVDLLEAQNVTSQGTAVAINQQIIYFLWKGYEKHELDTGYFFYIRGSGGENLFLI
jgi:hypothetical protein